MAHERVERLAEALRLVSLVPHVEQLCDYRRHKVGPTHDAPMDAVEEASRRRVLAPGREHAVDMREASDLRVAASLLLHLNTLVIVKGGEAASAIVHHLHVQVLDPVRRAALELHLQVRVRRPV